MNTINSAAVISRNPDVVFRQSVDKLTLVHLHRSSWYATIDGLAKDVWTMLDGRRSLLEISESVQRSHGIDSRHAKQLRQDVIRFAAELLSEDLARKIDL